MANNAGFVLIANPSGPSESSHGVSAPRVRSRVACRGCNHRKIRCDVTRTGIPCSNCVHEVGTCEVVPRKKHRPRSDRKTATQPVQDEPSLKQHVLPYATAGSKAPNRKNGSVSSQVVAGSLVESPETTHNQHEIRTPSPHRPKASSVHDPSPLNRSADLKNSECESIPASLDPGEDEEALPDDNPLSYIGDKRGPRFFVYDVCYPGSPQDGIPYLHPRQSAISWKPHEVEYLRQEGAFNLLPEDICNDLVRCYFHHVHFFLPIVDATSFLTEYDNNGLENISLLLFWCMLLAAANFVEPDVLKRGGFASRKAMKTAIYTRAKCLYDLDRGTDKLVLIQSVILMGFWYTDPQDHTGAWYWIGIAIGLSQALGLHRGPQSNDRSQRFSEAQQPVIRRIWWTCVVRDRWLSLAKGRPMRIHHEDCDLAMPVPEDILNNLEHIPLQTRSKFIPQEVEKLSSMWIDLVKISDTLGKILRVHYRVNGPKPLIEDINSCAEHLPLCKPQEILAPNASDLLRLHAYHVELFYEATVIVLFRPYVLSGPSAVPLEAQASWQKMALDQARAAASNTNTILERIIEINSVHFLKPMMITTIIPAMQIHLFDSKFAAPLRRGLGNHKLNLCMLVLSQLRNTYWSASVIFRLFGRAQAVLEQSNSENPAQIPNHKHAVSSQSYHVESRPSKHAENSQRPGQQHHEELGDAGPASHQLQETSSVMPNEQNPQFWMNSETSHFGNVDQLLSPSFSIPENTFPTFLAGYDAHGLGVYNHIVPGTEDVPIDLLYQI